jgi:hypothetical protein
MLQPQKNPTLPKLMVCRIIWAALLAGQIMYFGVVYSMMSIQPQSDNLILKILPIIASVALILSVLVPRFIWKNFAKKLTKPIMTNSEDKLVESFLTGFIIRLALLESVALMGLALFLLSGDIKMMIPYSSVSILGFLINFPNKQKIMDALTHE